MNSSMPKLWHDTISAHRSAVADAIMEHTAAIAAREGLTALTMARIATETGIGRATLYKYFKDVEDILAAWHQRQVTAHLEDLSAIRARVEDPLAALEAVLLAYLSHSAHGHHGSLGRLLHAMPHVETAQVHLSSFVASLIADAVSAKVLPKGASAEERARYVLAALQAPVTSKAAATRLVRMVLTGLGAAGDA